MGNRKKPEIDLRKSYTIYLEFGLIATLLLFITALKVDLRPAETKPDFSAEQETVKIEDMVHTRHEKRPPPPPPPQVPVVVPDDAVIDDPIIDMDAEIDLDRALDVPSKPSNGESEEDFFIVVEQEPELIDGLAALQKKARYPEQARKAGIEGRVIVQFIVNGNGKVEDPTVVRGIGGGCDAEALRVAKMARFMPGRQRGKTVRVLHSLPIMFDLRMR